MEFTYFKDKWAQFTSAAIWLIAIVTTFLLLPPSLSRDSGSINTNFCRFIIAGIVALLFIPLSKFNKHIHFKIWYRFAIVSFVLALIVVVFYSILYNNWSVKWYDKTLVIGNNMYKEAILQMPRVAKDLNRPTIDIETFVRTRKGETQYIWPIDEIKDRFYILCIFYVSSIVMVSIFLISVLQAIYCYEQD